MAKVISPKKFKNDALEAHNKYRKLHDAPPLELDNELCEQATDWAEHLAEIDQLAYRNTDYNNEPIGENILRARNKNLTGDESTNEWYKEEALYNYDGKFSPNIGHFTQVVWKNTKKVGFGFAINDKGTLYVVANYFPAGNYKNEFNLNVLKPKSLKFEASLVNQILSRMPEPSLEPIRQAPFNPVQFDQVQDRFIHEALNTHNICRKKHGAEPLVHNPELSKIAQNYAKYLANRGGLVHSTNTYKNERLGENLAYNYDSRMDYFPGEKATMDWYNEISMHRFGDYQSGTGHFTQVVWKGSKEVGFGVAKARDGSFYAVANYYPAGNFIGKFSQNVSRPIY